MPTQQQHCHTRESIIIINKGKIQSQTKKGYTRTPMTAVPRPRDNINSEIHAGADIYTVTPQSRPQHCHIPASTSTAIPRANIRSSTPESQNKLCSTNRHNFLTQHQQCHASETASTVSQPRFNDSAMFLLRKPTLSMPNTRGRKSCQTPGITSVLPYSKIKSNRFIPRSQYQPNNTSESILTEP